MQCLFRLKAGALLLAQTVKNLPAMWEAQAQSLGKKDSPEKGNGYLLEYSWLGNPMEPQFSSVAQSCPTLCDPMNRSIPGLPVHHHLPEFSQVHVHWTGDAIQPSHPLSPSSLSAFNVSQHQGLFQWVSFSHQMANGQSTETYAHTHTDALDSINCCLFNKYVCF